MRILPLLCLLATEAAFAAEAPLQLDQLIQEALRHGAGQPSAVTAMKRAYCGLGNAHRMQDSIERHRELLRNLLRIADANYSDGKGLEQDVLKAQVQISLLEPRLIEAGALRRQSEAEINALAGRSGDSPLGWPPTEASPSTILSLEDLTNKRLPSDEASRDVIADAWRAAHDDIVLLDVYKRTILPQSRFAAHASLVSYQNGSSDFLNALTSQIVVFDAEKEYDDRERSFCLALVRLEELTGTSLMH